MIELDSSPKNKTCQHRIQYVDFIDGHREMRCRFCRLPWNEVASEAAKQKRARENPPAPVAPIKKKKAKPKP